MAFVGLFLCILILPCRYGGLTRVQYLPGYLKVIGNCFPLLVFSLAKVSDVIIGISTLVGTGILGEVGMLGLDKEGIEDEGILGVDGEVGTPFDEISGEDEEGGDLEIGEVGIEVDDIGILLDGVIAEGEDILLSLDIDVALVDDAKDSFSDNSLLVVDSLLGNTLDNVSLLANFIEADVEFSDGETTALEISVVDTEGDDSEVTTNFPSNTPVGILEAAESKLGEVICTIGDVLENLLKLLSFDGLNSQVVLFGTSSAS